MQLEFTQGYGQYKVDIEPKKSITIQRDGHKPTSFKVGDWAIYDSYNLYYTGIIRQITEKTVIIESYPDTQNAKKHRLKIVNFAWRNYNFDAERIRMENAETSNYI
jgi:hypothetical protein